MKCSTEYIFYDKTRIVIGPNLQKKHTWAPKQNK